MRLAYCIPSLYYPSGMERVLTLKVNYFVANFGYEVHIILTDGKGKSPYYDLHPDVIIHQLDINFDHLYHLSFLKKYQGYIFKQRLFKKRLRECLHQIRPDITVSLLRRDINFLNEVEDGSLKFGEIHFNRSNYRDFTDNNLPSFIQKLARYLWNKQLIKALRQLETFVVLSHEDAIFWPELSNIQVIHNPLSFYPSTTSQLDSKQAIAVGRYVPQKGFDLLISSWRKVVDKHPDWILKIYGDGMKDDLQLQINDLSLQDNCFLLPSVSNIVDKYIESSIFILSSRYEGFGMVITEAMACGVPPVAFACPCGPRDIISDGVDGILVDNGNTALLADKICVLIENEQLRKLMGSKARINVQRFMISQIAFQWKQLFERAVNKHHQK